MYKASKLFVDFVYPKDIKKQFLEIRTLQDTLDFFTKNEFVMCASLFSRDETELELIYSSTKYQLNKRFGEGGIKIDLDQVHEKIQRIKKEIENGIEFSNFVSFIIQIAIFIKGAEINRSPDRLPMTADTRMTRQNKGEEYFASFIFISTDGSLLEQRELNSLIKTAKEIAKSKLKRKKSTCRRYINTALRHEVFKRDGYRCRQCGRTKNIIPLNIDHILPYSKGGTDELDNLQVLCIECNQEKKDSIQSLLPGFLPDNKKEGESSLKL